MYDIQRAQSIFQLVSGLKMEFHIDQELKDDVSEALTSWLDAKSSEIDSKDLKLNLILECFCDDYTSFVDNNLTLGSIKLYVNDVNSEPGISIQEYADRLYYFLVYCWRDFSRQFIDMDKNQGKRISSLRLSFNAIKNHEKPIESYLEYKVSTKKNDWMCDQPTEGKLKIVTFVESYTQKFKLS